MAEEIVFHHNPRSRAQTVRWMLEEAGAPDRIVPVDFEKGEATLGKALAAGPCPLGGTFGAPGLEGEKVLDDYIARLSARPAAQRTVGG